MSSKSQFTAAWPAVALAAGLLLAGCGGGGGGGADAPAAPPAASDPGPALNLQFRLNSEFNPVAWPDFVVTENVLSMSAQPLMLAQLGVDMALRLAKPGAGASASGSCPGGGSFLLTLTDADGDGRAGTGDTVLAQFTACGLPVINRAATGSVRVDIDAASPGGIDASLQARLSIVGSLRLEAFYGFLDSRSLPAGELTGSLRIDWRQTEVNGRLRALSSAADDLKLVGRGQQLRWLGMSIEREVQHDTARVNNEIDFRFDVDGMTGRARGEGWSGPMLSRPAEGLIRVQGAPGRTLILRPQTAASVNPGPIATIENSGGSELQSSIMSWGEDIHVLRWDGYSVLGTRYPLRAVPGSYTLEVPRDATGTVGGLVLPLPGGGSIGTDRFFKHPASGHEGSAAAAAVFRLHLGLPVRDDARVPSFRFVNLNAGGQGVLPTPPIAAQVTRRGALWLLSPDESLSPGAGYELQVSPDGLAWGDLLAIELPRSDGGTLGLQSRLSTVFPPDLLALTISTLSTVLLGGDDRLQLMATVSPRRGQGIASLRWQQLSGTPLRIEGADTATPTLQLPPTAPRQPGEVLMMFTATDTLGNVHRQRLRLTVGDTDASGAIQYQHREYAPIPGFERPVRVLSTGPGGVRTNPETPEALSLSAAALGIFDLTELRIAAPGRVPLSVAAYPGARLDASLTDAPWLGCVALLCDPQATGSFEVLEIERNAQGEVTRMAVDYEQSHPSSNPRRVRGSFRYRSTLPVRP
jgi:hypothetical protein